MSYRMKTECVVFLVFLCYTLTNGADDTPCTADGSMGNEERSGGRNASFICASPRNGVGPHKTFASRCALATYNCRNKNAPYIYRHDGPCNNSPNDACRHTCPSSDKPVCGGPISGSGPNKTFSSICELQNFNCDYGDAKYRIVHEGRCEEISCHRSCPNEDNPICARPRHGAGDLRTFKNRCELDNYNCAHSSNEYDAISNGVCPQNPGSHCQTCPPEHNLVCGKAPTNEVGKTFGNRCELDRFNCLHNTNYEYKHDGKCVQSCTTSCLQNYKPVCAASLRGDKPPRSFYNRCFLDRHNCEADIVNSDDIFEFLYPGECQVDSSTTSRPAVQCPKPCPRIPSPVCASSISNPNLRKTFYNQCELDNHNCLESRDAYILIKEGRCESESIRKCRVRLCSKEIESPFCAKPHNGIGPNMDFLTSCALDNYNCLHPNTEYEYYHDGACDFEKPPPPPSASIQICKRSCPDVEDHVCGQSQFFRSTITFKNMCELENYNCDHGLLGTYDFLHHGKCKEEVSPNPPFEPVCRKNCSNVYDPVCAAPTWGLGLQRDFHNPCYLEAYNCEHFLLKYKVLHAGKCTPNKPSGSLISCQNIHCTHEYLPICGISRSVLSLQKSFSNLCMMNQYNCEHGTDQYDHLHDGECKPSTPPPSSTLSCIKDCECTYNPVCAKPRYGNGPKKEFANRCKLDNYNCENYLDPHDVIHVGKCGIQNSPIISISPKSCIRDCECDYRPVCATPRNGMGPPITFTNRCKLNNHNCEHPHNQYQELHDGACPKSEKIVMPPQNLPIVQVPSLDDCFRECNRDYTPICAQMRNAIGLASIKRTFRNRCEFENHNCLFRLTKYDYLYDGTCIDIPIVY